MKNWRYELAFGILAGVMVFCVGCLINVKFPWWVFSIAGFSGGALGTYVRQRINQMRLKKTIKDLSPYDKELDSHSGKS